VEYAPHALLSLEKQDRQMDGRQTVTLRLTLDANNVTRKRHSKQVNKEAN